MPALEDVLDVPAAEGARLLAASLLDEVAAEHERWQSAPADVEALHDFRVALRRLRSWLRGFRDILGDAVSPKVERRLRSLQEVTGYSRDADVQREWLEHNRESLSAEAGEAARWLTEQLPASGGADLGWVRKRFSRCEGVLRARFGHYALSLPVGAPPAISPFSWEWATVMRGQLADLIELGAAVQSVEQAEALHRVRIRAKRVRYCLLSLKEWTPEVAPALKLLKQRQDALGELNDRHVMIERLHELQARAEAAGQAVGVASLVALARVQQAQRYEKWVGLRETDLALTTAVEAVAAKLSRRRGLVLEIMPAP